MKLYQWLVVFAALRLGVGRLSATGSSLPFTTSIHTVLNVFHLHVAVDGTKTARNSRNDIAFRSIIHRLVRCFGDHLFGKRLLCGNRVSIQVRRAIAEGSLGSTQSCPLEGIILQGLQAREEQGTHSQRGRLS